MNKSYTYYEFFAGGGMARAGLGSEWKCLFANDFDHKKSNVYRINWGSGAFRTADIRSLNASDIPDVADLAWGSFPCQDLSLAGGGAGLKGERSGTFYPFWDLMRGLAKDGRSPRMIVLENVCGALTSHQGADFAAICSTFAQCGYRYGAVVVDAELFVPHSRPRLFFIGVLDGTDIPTGVVMDGPADLWHPHALRFAHAALPKSVKTTWTWWNFPEPSPRTVTLADLIEDEPSGVRWHTQEETSALLRMMSAVNLAKVEKVKKLGTRVVGGIYKRTRLNETGVKVQRAEVRFDDVSGCLRTPAGGSSRQLILVVHGSKIRSRLITTRETARLMGLPDTYRLPSNYNEGYHLTGDGVVVPVVRHLACHVFERILAKRFPGWENSRMSSIPCEQNAELDSKIKLFAEVLKTQAHTLGAHGLDEKEFYNSGLFRGAIERIRGQFSATMREKREFVQHVLNYMQDKGFIQEWDSAGDANRHDYSIKLKSGKIGVIELKGCLDGNNTNIFERPSHAKEFIIWSLCSNPGADPRHNVWSGIHTRLSAEIISRNQQVDGLLVWDWVCSTLGRPCPKIVADGGGARLTEVGPYRLPPACIYLFPGTIPTVRNNPHPPPQAIADVELLRAFHECFKGHDDELNHVTFEVSHSGADTVRQTTITRAGTVQRQSGMTPIQRS